MIKHNLIKNSFTYKFYNTIMPFVYNIGAAVVIFGAMFKLLNLPGGSMMLGLGLSTEALIFLLSAFAPKEKEIDWSRVYPELAPDYKGESLANRSVKTADTLTQHFDQCLEKASIDISLLENLAATMRLFSENMANIPSLDKLTHYFSQMEEMADTLTSMNGLYKKALTNMEAQTADTATIHNHLDTALKAMEVAGSQAIHFKKELALLNEKVIALNEIYAKTLSAFKS